MNVLVVLVGLAVVGLIAVGQVLAAKRRKELAAWARARGATFSAARERGMDDLHPAFPCLRKGSNRYAYNLVRGRAKEKPFCAFDYHYETYSTDSKGNRQTQHHHFSCALVQSGLALHPLFIRPEGFLDKVTEFFGFDDIDFESAEFSRKFYVKAPDRKWAFDALPQETLEFLLRAPRYSLAFGGGDVLAWRHRRLSAADFDGALDVICGILSRLPPSVVRELKEMR